MNTRQLLALCGGLTGAATAGAVFLWGWPVLVFVGMIVVGGCIGVYISELPERRERQRTMLQQHEAFASQVRNRMEQVHKEIDRDFNRP